jgi:transposase-like protein
VALKRALRVAEQPAVDDGEVTAARTIAHRHRPEAEVFPCPYCSSLRVTVTASGVGIMRQLTEYRCEGCSKTWAEVEQQPHAHATRLEPQA